ncbi:hypothetical protein DERF_002379 [Dermatophagoides farinae]|uniref:Coiled-coil domain-containing protein 86 n=2 Tax=Dermatophagoides farinae TaxID=6954 RepID=A0A922LAF4_DERFA|nr:coiled-coil domain-containing protein 86-like [Dermatophagoides farinae]KAH9528429.1 hypothetical protein DERF_002379 [Dermatophagoides farinae]
MAKTKNKKNNSKPFRRNLVLDKPIRTNWKKKMQLKHENTQIKALEAELKAEKRTLIEEKRQRRVENQKRREENAKKAEIVQTIRNKNKLKKLKGSRKIRKV